MNFGSHICSSGVKYVRDSGFTCYGLGVEVSGLLVGVWVMGTAVNVPLHRMGDW